MATLVNLSNHPSGGWSDAQITAAKALVGGGNIIDLTFPEVDPYGDENYIAKLSEDCLTAIKANDDVECVVVDGELSLSLKIISELKKGKVRVVAPIRQRKTLWSYDTRVSVYPFARFREL